MNIPLKINQRERKVLLIGGIVILLIIAYQFIAWYGNITDSMRENIEAKKFRLEKQLNKIPEKENMLMKSEIISNDLKMIERGLLPGAKPPVAAARIQKILKEMALSLDINIKLEKALNPVDGGTYIGIPVEIGFSTTTEKLKKMIYRIKTSSLILTIPDIRIRVTNIRNPTNAYTTMTVKGFIKKPQKSSENKKEVKNAS
ncbi:MAG: GspMb/PilO family protein [Candidatus Mariimomonas ferrooxydans]